MVNVVVAEDKPDGWITLQNMWGTPSINVQREL